MPATQLRLGPADHGRALSWEEYQGAEYKEGHKYELIRGRLEVSPVPNTPENKLENWLYRRLLRYSDERPEAINYVTPKGAVFVHAEEDATCPEPDIAAYRDFPPFDADVPWPDVSPVLVCEVLVEGDPRKDLVRNVGLYFAVPSIEEYWVLDGRADWRRPTLIAHRRAGAGWEVAAVPFGGSYAPPLLPGFALVLDPRR